MGWFGSRGERSEVAPVEYPPEGAPVQQGREVRRRTRVRRQKTMFKNKWRKSDSRFRSFLYKAVNVFSVHYAKDFELFP